MVQPATELAAITSAFELVESKEDDGKDVHETDELLPCRLTIGDFRSLGEFLNEFSGYGIFASKGLQE
jgi:hypothetical protein